MSVDTTADKLIRELKDDLQSSYKKILIIIDPDTCGLDEYKDEFIDKLHEAALEILRLKRLIS